MNDIQDAVKRERKSARYAEEFFAIEADYKKLFLLDTHILDKAFKKKGKVLDAMMGRGRFVLHFANRGYQVHGNDYNEHMVKLVRKDLKKRGLNATVSHDNVMALPFPDGSFDYVICMFSSLPCIPKEENRKKAMAELVRVLKPGGFLAVHAHNVFRNLNDAIPSLWRRDLEFGDCLFPHPRLGTTYLHFYSARAFRKLFTDANISIEESHYLSSKQDKEISGVFKSLRAGGFIFIGRR